MLKMLKLSKLSKVPKRLGMASRKGKPFIPGMPRSPRSLNGIFESKKSAERSNVINDENHEWTDSPNHQKPQTQQDYDLVHITSMRKTRRRLICFTLTLIGQLSIPWSKLTANQNGRKSVDPGTCDISPGFLWYLHHRFWREWFF